MGASSFVFVIPNSRAYTSPPLNYYTMTGQGKLTRTRRSKGDAIFIRPIVVGQPITNLWLHLVSLLVFGVLATWVASALIRRRLIK